MNTAARREDEGLPARGRGGDPARASTGPPDGAPGPAPGAGGEAVTLDRLLRSGRRRPLFAPGARTHRVALGRLGIEALLPHRDPFLLLDRVDWVDRAAGAIGGRRRIDPEDPVFAGHFPGDPVYPGVLLIEMMSQLGLCLFQLLAGTDRQDADQAIRFRLLKVQQALFLDAVRPGETVEVQARCVEAGDYVSTCVGQVLGGSIRALGVSQVYCHEPPAARGEA